MENDSESAALPELDIALALRLCGLTSEFYRANAESFSQTRQSPWQGWERVLTAAGVGVAGEDGFADYDGSAKAEPVDGLQASGNAVAGRENTLRAKVGTASDRPFRVLDLACGNMRFERYAAQRLAGVPLACFAVDNCAPLVDEAAADELPQVAFQNLNVIDALASGGLAEALDAPADSCDLAVSFGFMHHVPLERWRVALLRALTSRVRSGGHVAVSFWRFLNSDKLAKKAQETTARAQAELGIPALPPNDFLLGWQGTRGLYRYCHHFDNAEIDRLLAAVADAAAPVARFAADGKTGNLNEYVVLRVR